MARDLQKEGRDILLGVAAYITEFDASIKVVLAELRSAVTDMNDVWDDAQYAQFAEYVEALSTSINQDLDALLEAGAQLKERADRY